MSRKQKKISVTLDPGLLENLDYISGRLGVSRSALISTTLLDAMAAYRELLEQVPLNPDGSVDVVRLRGASGRLVQERIEQLQGMANDLFVDK